MIKKISLENFKCFRTKEEFDFSKINLLTGVNGRGKSSLLQSLLLLSQTFRKKRTPEKLFINGEWVELGSFEDIKNIDSVDKEIHIIVETDNEEQNRLSFKYGESATNERIADLLELKVNEKDMFTEMSSSAEEKISTIKLPKKNLMPLESIKAFSVFYKFRFISADRLGPVDFVKKIDETPESMQIGIRGNNVINMLAYNGNKVVNDGICLNDTPTKTLKEQTIEWLSYILDGANIEIKKEKNSSILSMLLNSRNDKHLYKPANVGFGYSYILPLIVTGLTAQEGDIYIVENPEAHLHPGAQARLIEFFAKIAAAGVQVFLETHSEHIINGMRLCALKAKFDLTYKDVSMYFFGNQFEVNKLEMDEDSQIKNWPEGFFDQQEKDLAEILKLGLFK
ncbi:DUF3696 domain-containing protein [uncultured Bacteroides sp.]|uniref:AAA family ATPase n=1 Tax=uncultured Bacteroides sp. TaxID=162156 RepID=UPI002AA740C3|nr:DUF3696 domain-containing protein [uncultured Bacteroides sp.]